MNTQENIRKELNKLFCAAADQLQVTSWTEFAKLVDVPYPTIYRIVNNKIPLSPKMYRRIQSALKEKGLVIEDSHATTASNTAQNITAPVTQTTTTTDERWFDLVAEKDAQINRLLCIIEKMQ